MERKLVNFTDPSDVMDNKEYLNFLNEGINSENPIQIEEVDFYNGYTLFKVNDFNAFPKEICLSNKEIAEKHPYFEQSMNDDEIYVVIDDNDMAELRN